MKSSEYERVVAEIANSVFARAEGFPCENVLSGTSKKWKGVSGFTHQIDVAIRGNGDIIMVECKHWGNRVVKVEHLLTFIARIADIRPTVAQQLHPVMVTSNRFQRGCYTLAQHYGVDLEIVKSAGSFAFSYKGMCAVGISPESGAVSLQGYPPTVKQSVADPPLTTTNEG